MQSTGILRPQHLRLDNSYRLSKSPSPTCYGLVTSLPGRLASKSRRALSSADQASPSASSAPANETHIDEPKQPAEAAAPKSAPTSEVQLAVTAPTAAVKHEGVERDWLQPLPGDWGGVADPQGIKEPDSSGVLFFFILIAGLSIGVHQLIKLVGARRPEGQLLQPAAGTAAVVVVPEARGLQSTRVPPSKAEASSETLPGVAASTTSSSGAAERASNHEGSPSASSASAQGTGALVTDRTHRGRHEQENGDTAGVHAAASSPERADRSKEEEEEESAEHGGGARQQETSDTEEVSEDLRKPSSAWLEQQPSRANAAQPAPSSSSNGAAARADAVGTVPRQAPAAEAAAPEKRVESRATDREPGPGPGIREEAAAAAAQIAKLADERRREGAAEAATASVAPVAQGASTSAGGNGNGNGFHARLGMTPSPSRSAGPQEQQAAGPSTGGTGPAAGVLPAASRPGIVFPPPSPFGFGGSISSAGGGSAAGPGVQAASPAAERIALPAVRPQPLSRAPDSSALAHLPNDDSLGSLRERAQLALRAAAAASEASQRAAAYAAAASSAASRAAEAAERAAAAATVAQAGLETAAESAIVAAEARVAQAAEAAKEAEGRAASAAAHATAYQDMSQSQADIAERASNIVKPAPQGPLSQLHQLWRSASSAFIPSHGAHQSNSNSSINPSGLRREWSVLESSRGNSAGGATTGGDGADSGSASRSAGGGGSGAAESISTTVKGLLSWLGHGDGNR